MATNQVAKIRAAAGDAKKEQKAYDEYVDAMRRSGQGNSIKPLRELRK